ncbi:MAG: TlpA family protein disulfide reductase [Planctomycetales bacterium]|nr:TlpA family protein disulfide reductase [Planctomycetales bacterium]
MKRIALILVCCAAVAALSLRPADAEPTLGIGSNAPALDIAHYFHENDPKVTKFKKGNVYVVEFWATWCPPCVASMPHLSELQTKYRNKNVQIISITDEDVETVENKLDQPHPQAEGTFAEVTAAYTLTADPDGSSGADYMEASNQNGIPTSFIVGKTGLIEWIGHPMELDEPLAAVVDGSWDREAFKEAEKQKEAFKEAVQQFAQLAGRGRYDEAGEMLKQQIATSKDPEMKERWQMIQHQFNLMTNQATKADFDFYREDLKSRVGSPAAVYQYAMTLYGITQNGGNAGPLAAETIPALEKELDAVDDENKAMIYEAIARLHTIDNSLEKAIAAQEKAVESSKDSRTMSKRMNLFLDELKSDLEKAGEEKSEETKSDEAPSDK